MNTNYNSNRSINIAPSQLSLDGTRAEVIQDWRPRDRYRRKTMRARPILRIFGIHKEGMFEVEKEYLPVTAQSICISGK